MNQQLQLANMYTVTKSDTISYDNGMLLYIGTGGDLRVLTYAGNDVTYRNIDSGTFLPVVVKKVFDSGTTADDILGNSFSPDSDSFSTEFTSEFF